MHQLIQQSPPVMGQVQSVANVSFEAMSLTILQIADW